MIYSGVSIAIQIYKSSLSIWRGDLRPFLAASSSFNWKLNYNGIPNPPLDKTDKNKRSPSDYLRSKVLVDTIGFDPIGVKAKSQRARACVAGLSGAARAATIKCEQQLRPGSEQMAVTGSLKTASRLKLRSWRLRLAGVRPAATAVGYGTPSAIPQDRPS